MELQIFNFITEPEFERANNNGSLQLSPIQLHDKYRREWNEDMKDFVVLTKNGELVNNSLYRVGGFGGDIKQDYFMLLKYVEAIYEYDFLKRIYPEKSRKELELKRKHLEGRWCILDKNGVEKKEFEKFKTPYIKRGSCIYSVDSNYYNIETNELYCNSSNTIESSEYLFLSNPYDKDPAKKGVMQINKKDGSWSVFS